MKMRTAANMGSFMFTAPFLLLLPPLSPTLSEL
jgi:hypothetical protein